MLNRLRKTLPLREKCASFIPLSSFSVFTFSCLHSRANLVSEVESLQNKLEEANLKKSVVEAKLAEFERQKKMIELDIQDILARHKSEVTERMSKFARVCFM